jgi:ubiquinone biosynthesis protein
VIGAVLVRHGWGYAFARVGLADLLHLRPTGGKGPGSPERLVAAIQELGPTFVKFGQVLSTRPDLLPADYIAELSKLQDTAPTVPFDEIKSIVEEELGRSITEVYASFAELPLAAASLGQVHAATLIDGQEVIVKAQRPGIADVIERDIEILFILAKFLERRWEPAKTYGLTDVVDEFAITIRE